MNVEYLMELVNAKCNDDARRAGVMTLGALRDGLAVLPRELPVFLVGGDTPRALSSYRGYYERLAIEPNAGYPTHNETGVRGGGESFQSDHWGLYEPGISDITIASPCTVGDMIAALDLADGERFEGYKGGQFTMDRSTFMHVAEYGTCGHFVFALRVEADRVVIETKEEEF